MERLNLYQFQFTKLTRNEFDSVSNHFQELTGRDRFLHYQGIILDVMRAFVCNDRFDTWKQGAWELYSYLLTIEESLGSFLRRQPRNIDWRCLFFEELERQISSNNTRLGLDRTSQMMQLRFDYVKFLVNLRRLANYGRKSQKGWTFLLGSFSLIWSILAKFDLDEFWN